MSEHTPHQRKIIKRYYDHREEILLARLQETVSELFLAETEGKRDQLWKRVEKAMRTLQVPASVAEHLLAQRKPEILAKNLRQWLESTRK